MSLQPDEVALSAKKGETSPWEMFFDGVSRLNEKGERVSGTGILFILPNGQVIPYPFTLINPCSKNLTEYQALIMGREFYSITIRKAA